VQTALTTRYETVTGRVAVPMPSGSVHGCVGPAWRMHGKRARGRWDDRGSGPASTDAVTACARALGMRAKSYPRDAAHEEKSTSGH